MATIGQYIRDKVGGPSWKGRFRKSARASAAVFDKRVSAKAPNSKDGQH